MGEELNLDTVEFLEGDDLFGEPSGDTATPENKEQQPSQKGEEKHTETKEKEPTEVAIEEDDSLFDDEPESVGGENKESEKAAPENSGTSPEGFNAYSSFAKAMKGDGLFQFLDDKTIENVKDAESFADAMDDEIQARLDDVTKRVNDALNADIPVDTVRQYEDIISRLESITEESISGETEQASRLRQNLLFQDFLNKGYKEDRAKQFVKRAVDNGTDIEDAKEALESNKQFYNDKYNELIKKGKEQVEAEKRKVREETAAFRKTILEKDKLFGSIEVDKLTRQKAFDAMTRIVGNDDEGNPVTAVQKYADENPVEFRSVLGLVWAMTDGFKELGNLIKGSVKKEVRSNLKEIERQMLGSTPRGGSPKFIGGEEKSDNAGFSRGWTFDV